MGRMRFLVDPSNRLTAESAERAYICGYDLTPWPSRNHLEDGELVIERAIEDSGNVNVPWSVDGETEIMLSTGTLIERDRPYHLGVELARGKINQVRNQLAEWQAIGLTAPPSLQDTLHRALQCFSRAVTQQDNTTEATRLADEALDIALEASEQLIATYAKQALAARHRQSTKLPTWLGSNLGHSLLDEATAKRYLTTFNAAVVPLTWRAVEVNEGEYKWDVYDRQVAWCRSHHVATIGGPLLQLGGQGVPDWLYLWEGDFDNVLAFVSDYVETVVTRFRGKMDLWLCASGMNLGEVLGLSEEALLKLVVRAVEIAKRIDPETPAVIRFSQPWAEYMQHLDLDLAPLHFADALVRTGLELGGLELEICAGYDGPGTSVRDVLDVSRLIDLWSLLSVPLYVSLTYPSDNQTDPKAQGEAKPLPATKWTVERQQHWVESVVPVLLSKPAVQGIVWSQLSDAVPHDYPWGGLYDEQGNVKPSLASLSVLRKIHLK